MPRKRILTRSRGVPSSKSGLRAPYGLCVSQARPDQPIVQTLAALARSSHYSPRENFRFSRRPRKSRGRLASTCDPSVTLPCSTRVWVDAVRMPGLRIYIAAFATHSIRTPRLKVLRLNISSNCWRILPRNGLNGLAAFPTPQRDRRHHRPQKADGRLGRNYLKGAAGDPQRPPVRRRPQPVLLLAHLAKLLRALLRLLARSIPSAIPPSNWPRGELFDGRLARVTARRAIRHYVMPRSATRFAPTAAPAPGARRSNRLSRPVRAARHGASRANRRVGPGAPRRAAEPGTGTRRERRGRRISTRCGRTSGRAGARRAA